MAQFQEIYIFYLALRRSCNAVFDDFTIISLQFIDEKYRNECDATLLDDPIRFVLHSLNNLVIGYTFRISILEAIEYLDKRFSPSRRSVRDGYHDDSVLISGHRGPAAGGDHADSGLGRRR